MADSSLIRWANQFIAISDSEEWFSLRENHERPHAPAIGYRELAELKV
jgi:hypothetical protein